MVSRTSNKEGSLEGQTVSHYRVLEKIGEGGMGEVYLAENISLDRKVALKFLPDYLQSDEVAQKRFLREAKSAAALDHPYICHIHEVGEAAGRNFIAMEYVKGQTLKEKLRQGRVSLKETLQIRSEVAEALEKAHSEGIVHRDLKPANIMLTPEGHVKVMDFGLAKRLPEAADVQEDITAALTQEGATLRTIAYMSPEQTPGKPADTRADIFSFGIILYEMLTSVHPFRRGTHADTSSAILNEQPPPLERYTEDTTDLLQHTLDKMLAKEIKERYQSIHEVWTNLNKLSEKLSVSGVSPPPPKAESGKWLRVGAIVAALVILVLAVVYLFQPSPTILEKSPVDSLAVLPLFNAGEDPADEFLCSGIASSLSSALSQLSNLRVLPTSELSRYRGKETTPRVVGEELNVKAVVMGQLLRQGDTVLIQVELTDVAENRLLWGKHYSGAFAQVFEMQEEMAREIVQALRLKLSGMERERLAKRYTESPKAHEYYLQGRFHWKEREPKRAEEYFQRAIDLDPNYALAYAGLAEACGILSFWLTSRGESPDKREASCPILRPHKHRRNTLVLAVRNRRPKLDFALALPCSNLMHDKRQGPPFELACKLHQRHQQHLIIPSDHS
jgi:non-specific serine/threonine protein kinase